MSMANLIAARRKASGMTQKQLADKLGVTDKAVSKWERGNGQPDIQYLQPLAAALGITVNDLLQGEVGEIAPATEVESEKQTKKEGNNQKRDRGADPPKRDWRRIAGDCFLVLGLLAIITVSIVDFAMNNRFTWSLLPISAIFFAWLCILPLLFAKKQGGDLALIAVTLGIFPFLYLLSRLTGGDWFIPVAIPAGLCGLALLWLLRGVFATKLTVWNKLAVSTLILAAGNVLIAQMLGNILNDGGFDLWNLLSVGILLLIAIVFFAIGRAKSRAIP